MTAALDVMLKGADLVADTALLTLQGKMGYGGRLLAVRRLDVYEFLIETPTPSETASALRRFLNTQSLFYNRNKHHFSLRCRWEGGRLVDGGLADRCHRQLAAQVERAVMGIPEKDLHGGGGAGRVMLNGGPVFRTEVLVEDLDPAAKTAVARKLEAELSTAPATVPRLGIGWHLALRADSSDQARAITEQIVVAERQDRGLLLNPNYQGYCFLGAERMEPGR
jgi:hypothetical protein